MINTEGKLEWFGGNEDALEVYRMLVDLAHVWDDLIDKDKPVTDADINRAYLLCLVYLPANPFYRQIQEAIFPMWITVVSAYETANHYERTKDEHGVEIAHGLRYAAGNIIAYMVTICVGLEQASQYMPEVWKHIMPERFDEYKKEHLDA